MAQTMSASVAAKTPISRDGIGRLGVRHHRAGNISVAAGVRRSRGGRRADGAHARRDPGEEGEGFAIGCCELAASVADALRPIGVGAPGGALEDQTGRVEAEIDVGPKVAAERGASGVVGEQGEGRECGRSRPSWSQGGFDAAVGEEGVAGELGEAVGTGHEFPLNWVR